MPKVTVEIKSRLIDWLYENHWSVYDAYVEGWTMDYIDPTEPADYQHFRRWLKKHYPKLIKEWKNSAKHS